MRSSQFPTMGETGKHYYNELRVSPMKTVPLCSVDASWEQMRHSHYCWFLWTLSPEGQSRSLEFNNWEDILEFGIQILKLYAQFCLCSFRFCGYIDGKHLPLEKPALRSPHLKNSRVATCKTFPVHS